MIVLQIQFIPFILFAAIFIIIAVYLFNFHAKKHLTVVAAFVMLFTGISFLLEGLISHPSTTTTFNAVMRFHLVHISVMQTLFYLSTLLFREHESPNASTSYKWQWKLLYIFVPYLIINAAVILFTNIYFEENLLIKDIDPNGNIIYGVPHTTFAIIRVLYQAFLYVLSSINIIAVSRLKTKDMIKKRARTYTAIAVVITCIAAMIPAIVNYVNSTEIFFIEGQIWWDITYRIMFTIAAILFLLSIIRYSNTIKIGKNLLSEFTTFMLTSFLVLLFYVVPILLVILLVDPVITLPILLSYLVVVVLFSHRIFNLLFANLKKYFEHTVVTTSLITLEAVQYAAKHYNSPKKVAKSQLLQLESVKIRAKQSGIYPEEALRSLLRDTLEVLKPTPEIYKKRSVPTLIYEMLRMIMFDQAVESQLLWDLGFNTTSLIPTNSANLRYPVHKNTDYTSVSKNSYKRLRKKAFEALLWQVMLEEEKAIRTR